MDVMTEEETLQDYWQANADLSYEITQTLVGLLRMVRLSRNEPEDLKEAKLKDQNDQLVACLDVYKGTLNKVLDQYEQAKETSNKRIAILEEELRLLKGKNERLQGELTVERVEFSFV